MEADARQADAKQADARQADAGAVSDATWTWGVCVMRRPACVFFFCFFTNDAGAATAVSGADLGERHGLGPGRPVGVRSTHTPVFDAPHETVLSVEASNSSMCIRTRPAAVLTPQEQHVVDCFETAAAGRSLAPPSLHTP